MIHRVARRFVLRRGQLVGCVVNQAFEGGGERPKSNTTVAGRAARRRRERTHDHLDWLRGRKRRAGQNAEAHAARRNRRERRRWTRRPARSSIRRRQRRQPSAKRQRRRARGAAARSGPRRANDSLGQPRALDAVARQQRAGARHAAFCSAPAFWSGTTRPSSPRRRKRKASADKAAEARASGEMKVPPLGRVDPPKPTPRRRCADTVADGGILGPAPLPPPAPQPYCCRTRLSPDPRRRHPNSSRSSASSAQPVLLRTQFTRTARRRCSARPVSPPIVPPPPNLAAILGGLQGGQSTADAQGAAGNVLAEHAAPDTDARP